MTMTRHERAVYLDFGKQAEVDSGGAALREGEGWRPVVGSVYVAQLHVKTGASTYIDLSGYDAFDFAIYYVGGGATPVVRSATAAIMATGAWTAQSAAGGKISVIVDCGTVELAAALAGGPSRAMVASLWGKDTTVDKWAIICQWPIVVLAAPAIPGGLNPQSGTTAITGNLTVSGTATIGTHPAAREDLLRSVPEFLTRVMPAR